MSYSSPSFGNPFGFTITPWVKRLLIINGVAFLLTLALSGLIPYLALVPSRLLTQPWSVVTYMFLHAGLFHLLFNMLALFFFGPPLEERWGGTEFVKFYLIAGIGGAVLSLAFPNSMVLGASGAVYGVMVAFAMYWPDNPIYIWGIFPVKAKWLVAFLVGISIFYSLSGGSSGVAHLAHLGGAATAFFYLRSPLGPSQWGAPKPRRKPRQWRVMSSAARDDRPRDTADDRPTRPSAREQRQVLDEVDRILDKISKEGLSALTDDERRHLDDASRRFRTN
jgi:membrane associated rhomboid family serine protease